MKWKLAKLIVTLIFLSPIIVLNVWGARMSIWTGQFQAENKAVMSGKKESFEIPAMPTSPLDWIYKKAKKSKAFNTEDLNSGRQISITKTIDFADVLRAGEEPPEDVFKSLYVEARAQQILSSYCHVAFETLARRCEVNNSETRELRDGRFEIRGKLNYVPNYDIGKPLTISGGEFIRTRVSFGSGEHSENPNADFAKWMGQAQEVCQRMKVQYGNCVLSNFSVSEAGYGERETKKGTEKQRGKKISFAAIVEVYAVNTKLSRNELEKFAKRSAKEVQ